MYIYFLSDYTVNEFQQSHDTSTDINYNKTDVTFEKNKWYKGMDGSNFKDFIEYTGTSPIQISDFTENEILCKDYLQRVIDSFNN